MRFAGFQLAQVLNAGTKQKRLERATALLRWLKFMTRNVFSSPTRNFLSKPSCHSATRTTESGRATRKLTSSQPVCSLSVRSLRSMWWSRLVLVALDDSTLLTRALKWILHTTLAVSFPVLSTTALDCCPVDTSSSKTARQHTQLVPRRTGSKPTAYI